MNTQSEYRTFHGWMSEGRCVRAGQKACTYFINPETSKPIAGFHHEQTEPLQVIDTSGWEIVPADEIRAQQKASRKPKLKLEFNSETCELSIWCGANRKAISMLRSSGFIFHPGQYKWVGFRPNVQEVFKKLTALKEYNIDLYIDGVETDKATAP